MKGNEYVEPGTTVKCTGVLQLYVHERYGILAWLSRSCVGDVFPQPTADICKP